MASVTVEALDIENASTEDLYMSIRVGENQKLARMVPERTFRFQQDAIGERKFGKLDVFKRIGSAQISIKPEAERIQEFSTKRSDSDMDVSFRLELGQRGCPRQKRIEAAAKLAKTETDDFTLQTKRYLLEHNLESRLAEAMQALRAREDPGDIASALHQAQPLMPDAVRQAKVCPPAPSAITRFARRSFRTVPSPPTEMPLPTPAVLRAKPENPSLFLAEYLEKTSCEYTELPIAQAPVAPTVAEAQAPVAPTVAEAQALRIEAQESFSKAFAEDVLLSKLRDAIALTNLQC